MRALSSSGSSICGSNMVYAGVVGLAVEELP
jgi:hypothetical protein